MTAEHSKSFPVSNIEKNPSPQAGIPIYEAPPYPLEVTVPQEDAELFKKAAGTDGPIEVHPDIPTDRRAACSVSPITGENEQRIKITGGTQEDREEFFHKFTELKEHSKDAKRKGEGNT